MDKAISSYRDLIAWQRAFSLGVEAYRLSHRLPDHERYGLVSQLRRGGVSIASNIAEGYGRGSRVDYVRFLKVARGALYELDTQLLFTIEFGYITDHEHRPIKTLLDESERVLNGLIRSLADSNE